jgi:hypothetical protein
MRVLCTVLALFCAVAAHAQTTATLQGRVFDPTGAVLPDASITLRSDSIGIDRSVATDDAGQYHIAQIPPGSYNVAATAPGFKSIIIAALTVDVGRTVVRDFHLEVGDRTETVLVRAERSSIDRASATVGHVVTTDTLDDIPLNGRRFTDLGLLVPGSVAPSQTGFSTTPIRGTGALAINTAGNREEAVGFLVNGVTTNNLTFGSLMFQPPIGSLQEFKVDNSAFSAEYGHVSGAIVNIVTRSGTNELHGEGFEFLRNDALDARNFFEFTTPDPHPFSRNQFGGSLGGPIVPGRTFFFATFEGLRQRQGLDMNSVVLSDEQRAAATDTVIRRLIELIPHANVIDADGTARFVGSADAVVNDGRWTVDVRHKAGDNDQLHAFYGSQRVGATEPTSQGNSIPGFGHVSESHRTVLTADATHIFGSTLLNEARFGRSALSGRTNPARQINPAGFGIRNGVERNIGLPQMIVAGGLNFGGPANYPQGRDDTSYVVADTLSHISGRHALRMGGEYRHFINNNFAEGTGTFNFPSIAAFLDGTANGFSITLGERSNVIDQRAASLFFQNRITAGSRLSVEVGLRYEWHVSPTERDNRFVVFDTDTASLLRVGADVDEIYQQNNRNFEPRLGVVWDIAGDGRTVARAAYAWAADEPGTTAVRDTAANPPNATPLTASGTISIHNAIETTRAAGLSPATVDPEFRNAMLQSWNVNIQRQLSPGVAATVGYFGSAGRHLRISSNINQPIEGVRPFTSLSLASPILPGTPLGNITQVTSDGFSSYHALVMSATRRLSRGLQFTTSYTWSKSLDTNSLNSSGFAVQNSYDIRNQYGLSDFDARHRFVLSGTYELPFTGHPLIRGWQLAAIVQSQSGNPINIVTSNSSLNGTPNTVRPDVTGPVRIVGSVDQWFDTSMFVPVDRFGNLGRNVVIGPPFHNTDLSVIKNFQPGAGTRLQFRADIFDLFNYANLGPPGNIVGSPTFGKISRTRFSTGEAGSSRQIQLAMRVWF